MRYRLQISLEYANDEMLPVVMGNWLKWIETEHFCFSTLSECGNLHLFDESGHHVIS